MRSSGDREGGARSPGDHLSRPLLPTMPKSRFLLDRHLDFFFLYCSRETGRGRKDTLNSPPLNAPILFATACLGATDRACSGDTVVGPAVPHAQRFLLQRRGPAHCPRGVVAERVRLFFWFWSAGRLAKKLFVNPHDLANRARATSYNMSRGIAASSLVVGCVLCALFIGFASFPTRPLVSWPPGDRQPRGAEAEFLQKTNRFFVFFALAPTIRLSLRFNISGC